MSCIHYKFKSSLDYDTLSFDGTHISLGDLKKAIITQKKLQGKTNEFELQITNAQSKDGEYRTIRDMLFQESDLVGFMHQHL